jgi:hypothetical protein
MKEKPHMSGLYALNLTDSEESWKDIQLRPVPFRADAYSNNRGDPGWLRWMMLGEADGDPLFMHGIKLSVRDLDIHAGYWMTGHELMIDKLRRGRHSETQEEKEKQSRMREENNV